MVSHFQAYPVHVNLISITAAFQWFTLWGPCATVALAITVAQIGVIRPVDEPRKKVEVRNGNPRV